MATTSRAFSTMVRPFLAEMEPIARVITLAEWTGARVHIAHHSAADSLYLLRAAKARGGV